MSKHKLKPGDKFKVVHNPTNSSFVENQLGKIFTLNFIDVELGVMYAATIGEAEYFFFEDEIEPYLKNKQLTFVFHD
jgi:hypothetical protein